jgi:hypothetical protein
VMVLNASNRVLYLGLPARYHTLPAHLVETVIVIAIALVAGAAIRAIAARRRDKS